MDELFGKYCYIDTPWIAGKKTRYRILGSGMLSNAWCEVPVTGRTELVMHDHREDVVCVVLDTLVSDDSIIKRFALKDVEIITQEARSDLISRQDILALAKDVILINGAKHRCVDATQIHELPSVKLEIIRCKDCKYWSEYEHINGKTELFPFCGLHATFFKEDDFCSHAERRTDEET